MTVPLALDAAAEVTVVVVGVLGRQVAEPLDGPLAAGGHTLAFNTAGLAAGVYLVRATVATRAATERFTLTVVR